MYQIHTSKKFIKDLKLLKRRSAGDSRLLQDFTKILVEKGAKYLDKKYNAHKLSGKYAGYWECHIKPDLLLIWKEEEQQMIITLARAGSHADLF